MLVTKSSRPSVSRTAAGMVTRWVIWFAADWADARKVMLSAATAGLVTRPSNASSGATSASTAAAVTLRRTGRPELRELDISYTPQTARSPGQAPARSGLGAKLDRTVADRRPAECAIPHIGELRPGAVGRRPVHGGR